MQNYFNQLILHSNDQPQLIGLLDGQMGIVLTITKYIRTEARREAMCHFETVADFLYDNIMERVQFLHDIGFSSGLSGIAWGVEYLTQHDILPDHGDDICSDVDKRIMLTNILRMSDFSLESGLKGLWHYTWARIQGNLLAGLSLPFDHNYLQDWYSVISRNRNHFPEMALTRLEAALQGNLIKTEIDFRQFVKPMDVNIAPPDDDLSLATGLASYITTKYF